MDGLPRTLSATQEQKALRGGAKRTGKYLQRVLESSTRPWPVAVHKAYRILICQKL